MKNITLSLLLLLIVACGSDQKNMQVKGTIKGLKKGTVYLTKANDTAFVAIDSFQVNKDDDYKFSLSANIEEPEAFYVELDDTADKDNRITFFGHKGLTTINTTLKDFGFDTKIEGSKEQQLLEEYILYMRKFQDQSLDLFKQSVDARTNKDELAYLASLKRIKNHKKRQYLYTTNFALANKNSVVAPYIALTEINDANINLLDTINGALTKDIKASKYGKALNQYIKGLSK